MKLQAPVWWVGLGLAGLQVPFVLTRHVQEDAYLTFRCAANLADLWVYGFNAGERVSASSSHLSVFTVAVLRLLTGDAFVAATQLLYGVVTIWGVYLLATSLTDDRRLQLWIWGLGSLTPVALTIGYTGMETGMLILFIGVIVASITSGRSTGWTSAAFVLLPWVRPDGVVMGLVVLAAARIHGRASWASVVRFAMLMATGLAAWLLFNRWYFGSFLTQTIIAKAAVWTPTRLDTIVAGAATKLRAMLLGTPGETALFLPIQTKYFRPLAIPLMIVSVAALAWLPLRATRYTVRPVAATALTLIAVVPPILYAAGGVVYPWYLWPSQLAIALVLIALAVGSIRRMHPPLQTVGVYAGLTGAALLALGQLLFAVSWGTQERWYRGGIGEQIAMISQAGDTLLLEPAGYIPFYAKLFTTDEIGLTSPRVTAYRRQYQRGWWPRFVTDVSPTFLVERNLLPDQPTRDGYSLSSDERAWFTRHYRLIQMFHYAPRELRRPPILGTIAALGSASDYYLYRRID